MIVTVQKDPKPITMTIKFYIVNKELQFFIYGEQNSTVYKPLGFGSKRLIQQFSIYLLRQNMLQVRIYPTKPEYRKYIFDERFICKHIVYMNGTIRFFEIWGEGGYDKTVTVSDGHFTVEITEVK